MFDELKLKLFFMKTNQLLLAILFFTMVHAASFGQVRPKLQYTVGTGGSYDGNIGLWGVNFSNELNVSLGKRTSFNTNLTFYQWLGDRTGSRVEMQKPKHKKCGKHLCLWS